MASLSIINMYTQTNNKQRCRDGVMNEFLFWFRHPLVPFLFHEVHPYIPLHFREMIFPFVSCLVFEMCLSKLNSNNNKNLKTDFPEPILQFLPFFVYMRFLTIQIGLMYKKWDLTHDECETCVIIPIIIILSTTVLSDKYFSAIMFCSTALLSYSVWRLGTDTGSQAWSHWCSCETCESRGKYGPTEQSMNYIILLLSDNFGFNSHAFHSMETQHLHLQSEMVTQILSWNW